MKISVIIPVYNEEKEILDCLESLSKQSFKDFEVIVVDDGSRDKTLKNLKAFRFNLRLRVFERDHNGPGAARNLGAKKARGEVLVFVDADMTFDKSFLEKLTRPIFEGKTCGTFSKLEYVSNPSNIWSDCWGINEGWVQGARHPKNYPDKQKVFRAILKKEFDRVDGFSLIGYTDDWTLSEKLNYQADVAGAVFYHKNPGNLLQVFGQAQWIGKRRYKMGVIGTLVAMARSSFPVSLVIGFLRAVWFRRPAFLIFKLVYDLGIFAGALKSFGGHRAK